MEIFCIISPPPKETVHANMHKNKNASSNIGLFTRTFKGDRTMNRIDTKSKNSFINKAEKKVK